MKPASVRVRAVSSLLCKNLFHPASALLCCKCFVYFEECSVVSDQSLNNNI